MMSSERFIANNDTEFVEAELDERWHDSAHSEDRLVEPQNPERKYSVGGSQQFSHYLNKDTSSRYQAIVLNVASTTRPITKLGSSRSIIPTTATA